MKAKEHKGKTPPQTESKRTSQQPDELNLRHQIEKRAYEIWLSSGCCHGNDIGHWFQAENEALAERRMNF